MENSAQHQRSTVVGYIRVSDVKGREGPSFISADVQREQVQRWADYAGVEVTHFETDLDESGGTQDRPALRRAMALIESGEVGGIACAKLDRFARNIAGAHGDLETIKRTGARLVCVAENIDTGASSAVGDFTFTVLLAVATMQRDTIAENWLVAKGRAVEGGRKTARAPLGYRRERNAKGTPTGPLLVDPETAPIVGRVFETAATGGLHAALTCLRDAQPGLDRDLFWVRRLLANRTYLGEQVHGELVNRNACPALVSAAVWRAAQPGEPGPRRRAPADYPLSGLATCATCGAPMVGSRSGRKGDEDRGKRGYRCSRSSTKARKAGNGCDAPALIDAFTLEQLVETAARGAVQRLRASASTEDGASVAQAEADLAQTALDAYLSFVASAGLAGEPSALAEVAQLRDARDTALARVESSRRREVVLVGDWAFYAANATERAAVIRATIARVVVARRGASGERVTFEYVGNDDDAERVFGGAARRWLTES